MSESERISLEGLNKADVLAALYNASKPQGMGMLHYNPAPMTREIAQGLLDQTTDFDYLKGRVMKINLGSNELDPRLYDRDNGRGAAEAAINSLRSTSDSNNDDIRTTHQENTAESVKDVQGELDTKSSMEGNVFRLGIGDMKEHLEPALERVKKTL